MAVKKRKLRAVSANEPITVETVVHPSQLSFEDEFEALLDAEGDAEFGEIQLKDAAKAANAADNQRATLATWTSQDFSSIYTRFRPHLERYSKRWLNNPSQIDEVVQDAFLYLMVTLPELDSEIGVLRFLKWKTRLLCLDVIRASGRAQLRSVDDYEHTLEADLPEHSAALEAADDAAVVRLALSKLNPRHREVLLATMYEEKSISEVALQLDLAENAARQLLFRARAAFKVALIGDVDTAGMSASAILSVAARKAGTEMQKQGAKALVSLFVLVLAVGSYFMFTGRSNNGAHESTVAAPEVPTGNGSTAAASALSASASNAATSAAANTPTTTANSVLTHRAASSISIANASSNALSSDPIAAKTAAPKGYINESQLAATAANGQQQSVMVYPGGFGAASAGNGQVYWVTPENKSYKASFSYSPGLGLSAFTFYYLVDGLSYTAYAQQLQASTDDQGHLIFTGKITDIIDSQDIVLTSTALAGAQVSLVLPNASLINGVQSAVLTIAPRA
jgi:RNA polymerase sigma factor (sigma-70 family)